MSKIVLDASALLALLRQEKGSEPVAEQITGAVLCSVNYAEVVSKLSEGGMPFSAIRQLSTLLPFKIIDFNEKMAFLAGELRTQTRSLGLSLGDRACLATGKILGLPIMTADRAWLKVEIEVEIRCIR
ncbi:twitching motility protein PilT [Thioploca ingrica]|uniref:Twitching motility protein PilT n=1 Tax=Thioploca ingrica TaxID=40754 RepID=A0A090AEV7_9GAMM|nr:twitching motility protein PilT [Thioploca ingrica]